MVKGEGVPEWFKGGWGGGVPIESKEEGGGGAYLGGPNPSAAEKDDRRAIFFVELAELQPARAMRQIDAITSSNHDPSFEKNSRRKNKHRPCRGRERDCGRSGREARKINLKKRFFKL